jgi:hypothetical protein
MEELLLTSGEPAYVNDFRSFYAHSFEGWTVSDGRNYKRPVVFEANEAAAEEMIHGYLVVTQYHYRLGASIFPL